MFVVELFDPLATTTVLNLYKVKRMNHSICGLSLILKNVRNCTLQNCVSFTLTTTPSIKGLTWINKETFNFKFKEYTFTYIN